MKSIPTALQTHLNQDVTTLATCWQIKRTDGVYKRFTDHDTDISFEGETYRSRSSYDRSAIEQNSSLAVDNVDIRGLFRDEDITREDVNLGRYDHAELTIFALNYKSPGDGAIFLRRGFFGEVRYSENGEFTAELRGLKNALSKELLQKYSPTCRAELGDLKCKFPIVLPAVLRNQTYAVGEYVRALQPETDFNGYTLPVINPGFETGDLTGWTIRAGDWRTRTSSGSTTPYEGSHFLEGDVTDNFLSSIFQDVQLDRMDIYDEDDIDAGLWVIEGDLWRMTTSDNADAGRWRVELLDANGEAIQEVYDTGFELAGFDEDNDVSIPNNWTRRSFDSVILPSGTRSIRIIFEGLKEEGMLANSSFDDLRMRIHVTPNGGARQYYGSIIYECTTSGTTASATAPPSLTSDPGEGNYTPGSAGVSDANFPTYPTVVGDTVTDGTAVFTARQGFVYVATVASVGSNSFTLSGLSSDALDDGFFERGVCEFETGENVGFRFEIREWQSGTMRLFLPPKKTISVGDSVILSPGCDKRRATCKAKFVIPDSADFSNGNVRNMRAEPDLPGRDAVITYPNADGTGISNTSGSVR